ncbi:MAG TPA: precorrin-6y C5,15-methyltransferase (decarboxylating) subunit CbiE [Pirellulaceae bacterium]|nr:precorrin-6y C5,15-methyltransferase (decarboxylating) subunit CbiE [Pirellulaceae bacterium]
MVSEKVHIVGIGDDGLDGLTSTARQLIERAELLIGGERSLSQVPAKGGVERLEVGFDLDAIVDRIDAARSKRIVVLASGDPLFYGTARYLCDRLGKSRFDVLPHVSSMQLAFARVKESWDEAYLTNLATQQLEPTVERIRTAQKVGLFTTESVSPADVAQALLDRKIDYFTAYVCENLGSPDERVTQGELSELVTLDFSPLNVLILVRKPNLPDRPKQMVGRRLFGNPDEMFLQSQPKRGLLTPAEVRSMALAELDLGPTSIVWDVGAGSGSVAIEAAQIASGGSVYAVEMDPEDYQLIATNAQRFGVSNLIPVLGKAPEAWQGLPDPDAVFVGGTGRQVQTISELAYDRLRPGGRIVANVSSIENVAETHRALRAKAGEADLWMINLSRGTQQLEQVRFESANPTFLIRAVKPGA